MVRLGYSWYTYQKLRQTQQKGVFLADNDIYEIVDIGYNNDQLNINVYHYFADNPVAGNVNAETLAGLFVEDVLPKVAAIQNTSLLHTQVQVKNLFDPTDAFTDLIAVPGTVTNSDEAPIMLAIGVTLSHNNAAVRKGRKAYGGLDEAEMANGSVVGSGLITSLGNLMTQLVDPLTDTLVDTYFPIVLSSLLAGGGYGVPANLSQAVYGVLDAATYNPLITTQNSRKTGRGD